MQARLKLKLVIKRVFFQPPVHGFVVFKVSSCDPFIIFRSVSVPSYKVFESLSQKFSVYDLIHHMFAYTVDLYWTRFFEGPAWEFAIVIGLEGFYMGCVEGWE